MKALLVSLIFFSAIVSSYSQSTIDFQADPGIRVHGGTTRNAVFRNDSLYLYYGYNLWDGTNSTPVSGLAIATDSPDYNDFDTVDFFSYPKYHFTLLPDGVTRRIYGKPMGNDYLISESTTDGWNVSTDPGVRYYLDPSDSSTFGVSTVVVDANDDVHIYYMGNMSPFGINNIRHCMSTDGGDNFTFQTNDVCGDYSMGGQYSHLDPFALLMEDNSIRLFTANAHGTIVPQGPLWNSSWMMHSFRSTDNGMTFTQETTSLGDDTIVRPSDFIDTNVRSLHDPKAVLLPDGRIKVFMNGSSFDSNDSLHWDIYSVTMLPDMNSTEEAKQIEVISVYPNPSTHHIQIGGLPATSNVQIYSIDGKLVYEDRIDSKDFISTSEWTMGVYIISIEGIDEKFRVIKR